MSKVETVTSSEQGNEDGDQSDDLSVNGLKTVLPHKRVVPETPLDIYRFTYESD